MASGNFILTNAGSTSEYITLTCTWESLSNGISENSSTVTISVIASLSAMASTEITGNYSGQATVNGVSQFVPTAAFTLYPGNQTGLFTRSYTVPHNYDGSKSTTISVSVSGVAISGSGADTVVLDNIPRYASITQTLQERTENSITINWVSDVLIDKVWYSIDNGVIWSELPQIGDFSSGSYKITSLDVNTPYSVKTRVKNKVSQLTTDSVSLNVTTYNYPYCLITPDFTIGTPLTLGFYNPIHRNITVNLIGNDGSQITNDSISGEEITGFNTSEIINKLYASIPSSKSGNYSVRVTYGTHVSTASGGEYRVNPNDCLPEITLVSYADQNQATISVTGDDQQIIQNQSTVLFTATGLAANKSATIDNCVLSVNSVTYNMQISGNSATASNVTINSANDLDAEIIVTDSRGLQTSKSVNVEMLEWGIPTAYINLLRQNNISDNTNITVNAIYSSLDNKNAITIQCRYKKTSDSSYGNYQTLQNGVTETLSLDNNYQWDVQVLLTDVFGSNTFNLVVNDSTPIIFFDKGLKSVGINCFPKDSEALEINGVNIKREAMSYNLSSNITPLTQSAYTQIVLDSAKSTNNNVFSASSGGILIGDSVNQVLISAQMGLSAGGNSGQRYLVITKNSYSASNILAYTSVQFNANSTQIITTSQQLIDVVSGDVIYLYYYTSYSSDTILGDTYGGRTYLTIEKLA